MNKKLLTTTAFLLATTFSTTARALTECPEGAVKYTTKTTGNITTDYVDYGDGNYAYTTTDSAGNVVREQTQKDGVYMVYEYDSDGSLAFTIHLDDALTYYCSEDYSGIDACIKGMTAVYPHPEMGSPAISDLSTICEGFCIPEYNSDGNITNLTYYDTQTGKTVLGTEEYTYSGNTVTAKKYTDATGTITEYDCTGQDNCSLTGTYKYTYDSDGDLLSKTTYKNGLPVSTENYALKIYTAEQAYAATGKGKNNKVTIRFK